MRAAAFCTSLMLAFVQSGAAWAHASLLRTDPAEGAVLAEPPKALRLTFNEPAMTVVTNVDARGTTAPDELRDALIRQVSAPVRWSESMQLLVQQGVDTFVEAGPDRKSVV